MSRVSRYFRCTNALLLSASAFIFVMMIHSCGKEGQDPVLSQDTVRHTQVIKDTLAGEELILVGNPHSPFLRAFLNQEGAGKILQPEAVQGHFPVILTDEKGNRWDFLGNCIDGPSKGTSLEPVDQMMGYWFSFSSMFPGIALAGEDGVDPGNLPDSGPGWDIPPELVFRGQFQDAIIALEDPGFEYYRERDHLLHGYYVHDAELVTGVYHSEKWWLIPHNVLDWHEIVNVDLPSDYLTIAYCPLTGTSRAWSRPDMGGDNSFGVSGLLFNNNMILYDRYTESRWVQLLDRCVNGPMRGVELDALEVVELTWQDWKRLLEKPYILTEETGFAIDYNEFPYGSYKTDHEHLLFPLIFDDTRLKAKERVLMVSIGTSRKVYSFMSLQ